MGVGAVVALVTLVVASYVLIALEAETVIGAGVIAPVPDTGPENI